MLKKLPPGVEYDASPYFVKSDNLEKIIKFINKNHGIMFPKEYNEE